MAAWTTDIPGFMWAEVPELSIRGVTPWQIKRLFEHQRHPESSADFD